MRPSSASRHGVNDLAIELKITDPAQLLDPGPLRPTTFTFWSSNC